MDILAAAAASAQPLALLRGKGRPRKVPGVAQRPRRRFLQRLKAPRHGGPRRPPELVRAAAKPLPAEQIAERVEQLLRSSEKQAMQVHRGLARQQKQHGSQNQNASAVRLRATEERQTRQQRLQAKLLALRPPAKLDGMQPGEMPDAFVDWLWQTELKPLCDKTKPHSEGESGRASAEDDAGGSSSSSGQTESRGLHVLDFGSYKARFCLQLALRMPSTCRMTGIELLPTAAIHYPALQAKYQHMPASVRRAELQLVQSDGWERTDLVTNADVVWACDYKIPGLAARLSEIMKPGARLFSFYPVNRKKATVRLTVPPGEARVGSWHSGSSDAFDTVYRFTVPTN